MTTALTTATADEITIVPDREALAAATQQQRNDAMTGLFIGLARAVRQGHEVNIDNPDAIRVRRRRNHQENAQEGTTNGDENERRN